MIEIIGTQEKTTYKDLATKVNALFPMLPKLKAHIK